MKTCKHARCKHDLSMKVTLGNKTYYEGNCFFDAISAFRDAAVLPRIDSKAYQHRLSFTRTYLHNRFADIEDTATSDGERGG